MKKSVEFSECGDESDFRSLLVFSLLPVNTRQINDGIVMVF